MGLLLTKFLNLFVGSQRNLPQAYQKIQIQGTGLNTEKVVSFAPGCGKHLAKPNRKREEAVVLENLRKKVEACRLMKAENNSLTSGSPSPSSSTSRSDGGLDNSPRFGVFNKVLSNRSASVPDRETIKQLEPQWERSEFINDCLHYHNVYRQRHGAPPLVLCSQLCLEAQTWANHLAHMNKFYYRNGREIGQNLFCRPMNTLQSDITGQEVTSYWYSSVRFYNYFKEPKILHANVNSGHFTQMIWISTKEFGIGKARSRSGKIIVVAHYRPPGNIPGLFHKNVLPPLPDYDSERTSESGSESSASKNAESCR